MNKKLLFFGLAFLALVAFAASDVSAYHYNSHYDTYSSTTVRQNDAYGNSYYYSAKTSPYYSATTTKTVSKTYYQPRHAHFGYSYRPFASDYTYVNYPRYHAKYYPTYRINSYSSYYNTHNYWHSGYQKPSYVETTKVYRYGY